MVNKTQFHLSGPIIIYLNINLFLNDFPKAQEYIDAALDHTPTLVEFYILKALHPKALRINGYSCRYFGRRQTIRPTR